MNHKRVERLWRREGLKVPQKQPTRGRLWHTDGSCIRRRPEYRHHVWAYDFVAERTHDGRPLKILTVVDEYSRECLALVVARRLRATDVLETLADLVVTHGVPAHLRSDNGPEFTAELVRLWLAALQVQALFIEPGSPWENGYVESFNGKLRDELLDREIFYTLTEAKILVERWHRQYNSVRPHSALGYRPPGARGRHASDSRPAKYELRALSTTGTTAGGRSVPSPADAGGDSAVRRHRRRGAHRHSCDAGAVVGRGPCHADL